MTVLALHQLIDAIDSMERYNILNKLGVDEGLRNKSLFTQIVVYFLVPLLFASLNGGIALTFFIRVIVEGAVKGIGNPTLLMSSFLMVLMIYVIYFIATYWQYKRVLRIKA